MATNNKSQEVETPPQDDTDADAFAVLSLLVIIAATLVYYLTH